MYKVGTTAGVVGVRLWDGEKVVLLDSIKTCVAKVVKEETSSYMELISNGVPYKGGFVDIKVRVTVFSESREAREEEKELNGKNIQFATVVNYYEGSIVSIKKNYLAVWDVHPEDVVAVPVDLGAAMILDPKDFTDKIDDGTQVLIISHPTSKLTSNITSAN